ncbi:immunity 49 family protein [Hahella sp. HN01]|uniref:immunity 49 family protein n=1 Tax=Hahella sp. HN01 TaxID=2847262 RepID=UPI001C1ED648|nr:immunity 49 family protein [Hahella sp. HN01]MBU6951960.1 immunity 49 family protein [Hahella sp. HN01]
MIKNKRQATMRQDWVIEYIDGADRLMRNGCKNLYRKSDNVLSVAQESLAKAREITLLDNSSYDQAGAEAIKLSAKAYAAYFTLAQNPDTTIDISLSGCGEAQLNGAGIVENGRIFPERWQEAYFTAVVARDRESMNSLASFPLSLLRSSATKSIEAEYVLVEALQSFHFRRDDFVPLINKASELAVAEGSDKALDITMGKIELLLALATNLGLDFNEVLEKNLKALIEFFEARCEEDVAPVQSFIPMELLGMAVLWFDAGNDLTVESDYLPKYCIEGTLFGV